MAFRSFHCCILTPVLDCIILVSPYQNCGFLESEGMDSGVQELHMLNFDSMGTLQGWILVSWAPPRLDSCFPRLPVLNCGLLELLS